MIHLEMRAMEKDAFNFFSNADQPRIATR